MISGLLTCILLSWITSSNAFTASRIIYTGRIVSSPALDLHRNCFVNTKTTNELLHRRNKRLILGLQSQSSNNNEGRTATADASSPSPSTDIKNNINGDSNGYIVDNENDPASFQSSSNGAQLAEAAKAMLQPTPKPVNGGTEQKNTGNALMNFFKFVPRPPETPPPTFRYEDLLEESDVADANIDRLQNTLVKLKRDLAQKEAELKVGRVKFDQERNSLLNKIADFANILQDKEEVAFEESQRRQQLEREVNLLQGQLPQVQNLLRSERQRADELRERLNDVEDSLEYQQMEFQKEKNELQEVLEKEKARLKEIENNWEAEKARFIEERRSIEQELKAQLSLVTAVEDAFDIMLDAEDILDFKSFVKAKEINAKYGITL